MTRRRPDAYDYAVFPIRGNGAVGTLTALAFTFCTCTFLFSQMF